MVIRWWKIGLLAGPLFLLAGLIVVGAIIWSMKGQFTSGVIFAKEIGKISVIDQQTIRQTILKEPLIESPKHALTRYRVYLNKRTEKEGITLLSGSVEPNRDVDPHGFIVITKKDGDWKVTSLVTSSL